MFTLGYLSLVQMFETVLGGEITSCLSYLTFINIWVLQRPILAWAINYSWLGSACYSSPICDFCTVVINGSIPGGQPPKRMLLLSSSWLLPPSFYKVQETEEIWRHTSSTDVHTFLSFLLFEISSSSALFNAIQPSQLSCTVNPHQAA